MKFTLSKTVLTNWEERIPAGLYKGIHVRIAGTANSGQTLAKGDVGNFTLNLNGQQIAFLPDAFLSDLNNQWFGYNEFASASAGAFTYGLFIPFEIPGYPNGLYVAPDDALFLGLQVVAAVATKVSSWAIDVNVEHTGEAERYVPQYLPANVTVGGAVTDKRKVPNVNIFKIWLTGASITRIQLERDGQLLHEGAYASLLSNTSLKNRVEAALATYIELACGDQVSDMLSDDVQLQFTASGATTAYIMYLSIMADGNRNTKAQSVRASDVARRLDKVRQSRPAEINTLLNVDSVRD